MKCWGGACSALGRGKQRPYQKQDFDIDPDIDPPEQ
jgi:hypothetical protein